MIGQTMRSRPFDSKAGVSTRTDKQVDIFWFNSVLMFGWRMLKPTARAIHQSAQLGAWSFND